MYIDIYIYVNVLVFNQVHIPLLSLIMVCKSRARVVLRSLSLVQSYLSPTSFTSWLIDFPTTGDHSPQ